MGGQRLKYYPPPFHVADALCTEITNFLIECGGPYKGQNRVTENVLIAIATGQFFYKRGCYFVCFWKVCDIEKTIDRIRPNTVNSGTTMYVVECGIRGNHMKEIIRKLRKAGKGLKGVLWHRPEKGDKVCLYPSQKGEPDGIE